MKRKSIYEIIRNIENAKEDLKKSFPKTKFGNSVYIEIQENGTIYLSGGNIKTKDLLDMANWIKDTFKEDEPTFRLK